VPVRQEILIMVDPNYATPTSEQEKIIKKLDRFIASKGAILPETSEDLLEYTMGMSRQDHCVFCGDYHLYDEHGSLCIPIHMDLDNTDYQEYGESAKHNANDAVRVCANCYSLAEYYLPRRVEYFDRLLDYSAKQLFRLDRALNYAIANTFPGGMEHYCDLNNGDCFVCNRDVNEHAGSIPIRYHTVEVPLGNSDIILPPAKMCVHCNSVCEHMREKFAKRLKPVDLNTSHLTCASCDEEFPVYNSELADITKDGTQDNHHCTPCLEELWSQQRFIKQTCNYCSHIRSVDLTCYINLDEVQGELCEKCGNPYGQRSENLEDMLTQIIGDYKIAITPVKCGDATRYRTHVVKSVRDQSAPVTIPKLSSEIDLCNKDGALEHGCRGPCGCYDNLIDASFDVQEAVLKMVGKSHKHET